MQGGTVRRLFNVSRRCTTEAHQGDDSRRKIERNVIVNESVEVEIEVVVSYQIRVGGYTNWG